MDVEDVVNSQLVEAKQSETLSGEDGPRPEFPAEEKATTFGQRFAAFKGVLLDLPPDLAEQHDHYRLGTPKR
jgi:hypothetical protein